MKKVEKREEYVIGVDGGGTKTLGILVTTKGKIVKKIFLGSTNPNKIGLKPCLSELKKLLSRLSQSKKEKIKFAYLGLAGGLERNQELAKRIEKILQKNFSFKIIVEGDQKIAFCSGTSEKNGVVIIAGTGAIAMGWKEEREAVAGGWDWLIGDQGSAFWVGKRYLEELIKFLDGRKREKIRTKDIFKKLKIKKEKEIYEKFYQKDFVKKIASFSKIVDQEAKKGNTSTKKILIDASKEIFQMTRAVIKKLHFQKEKFPLVAVGGMFKSKILRENFEKKVKKEYPLAKIIFIRQKSDRGIVRMVMEKLNSGRGGTCTLTGINPTRF